MDSDYLFHRVDELRRSVTLFRETIERRYPPDDVIDQRVDDIEMELTLLTKSIKEMYRGSSY